RAIKAATLNAFWRNITS
ncbi:hypothetical protein BV011_00666B, partial [Haemophilus influenzae]